MDSLMSSNYISGLEILPDRIPRNSYTAGIPALNALEALEFNSRVTFFTGENGSGKSTLLEGIAVAYGFNPEGGTKNFMFSTRGFTGSPRFSCRRAGTMRWSPRRTT